MDLLPCISYSGFGAIKVTICFTVFLKLRIHASDDGVNCDAPFNNYNHLYYVAHHRVV